MVSKIPPSILSNLSFLKNFASFLGSKDQDMCTETTHYACCRHDVKQKIATCRSRFCRRSRSTVTILDECSKCKPKYPDVLPPPPPIPVGHSPSPPPFPPHLSPPPPPFLRYSDPVTPKVPSLVSRWSDDSDEDSASSFLKKGKLGIKRLAGSINHGRSRSQGDIQTKNRRNAEMQGKLHKRSTSLELPLGTHSVLPPANMIRTRSITQRGMNIPHTTPGINSLIIPDVLRPQIPPIAIRPTGSPILAAATISAISAVPTGTPTSITAPRPTIAKSASRESTYSNITRWSAFYDANPTASTHPTLSTPPRASTASRTSSSPRTPLRTPPRTPPRVSTLPPLLEEEEEAQHERSSISSRASTEPTWLEELMKGEKKTHTQKRHASATVSDSGSEYSQYAPTIKNDPSITVVDEYQEMVDHERERFRFDFEDEIMDPFGEVEVPKPLKLKKRNHRDSDSTWKLENRSSVDSSRHSSRSSSGSRSSGGSWTTDVVVSTYGPIPGMKYGDGNSYGSGSTLERISTPVRLTSTSPMTTPPSTNSPNPVPRTYEPNSSLPSSSSSSPSSISRPYAKPSTPPTSISPTSNPTFPSPSPSTSISSNPPYPPTSKPLPAPPSSPTLSTPYIPPRTNWITKNELEKLDGLRRAEARLARVRDGRYGRYDEGGMIGRDGGRWV